MAKKRKRTGSAGKQLELDWKTWGGPRRRAGRPRGKRARVPHRTRGRIGGSEPVHVTIRTCAGLGGLRDFDARRVVHDVFREK